MGSEESNLVNAKYLYTLECPSCLNLGPSRSQGHVVYLSWDVQGINVQNMVRGDSTECDRVIDVVGDSVRACLHSEEHC